MSTEGARALEDELGSRPPDGLKALSDSDLRAFAGVLHEARKRQSAALESAVEESLEIVPRMVRGPVRKALFG